MKDSPKPSAIQQYELHKKALQKLNLPHSEYEKRIKALARELGV